MNSLKKAYILFASILLVSSVFAQDPCNELEAELCEALPFCELTDAGCVLAENDWGNGDWWDDTTGWDDDHGGGHGDGGGHWDDDWEDYDFCNQFEADQCEMMPFCELTDEG